MQCTATALLLSYMVGLHAFAIRCTDERSASCSLLRVPCRVRAIGGGSAGCHQGSECRGEVQRAKRHRHCQADGAARWLHRRPRHARFWGRGPMPRARGARSMPAGLTHRLRPICTLDLPVPGKSQELLPTLLLPSPLHLPSRFPLSSRASSACSRISSASSAQRARP